LASIQKLNFLTELNFKIVLKNTYPTESPRIFFTFENGIEVGLNPYRDYLKSVVPDWGPKIILLDILKLIPAFIVSVKEKGPLKGEWRRGEHF